MSEARLSIPVDEIHVPDDYLRPVDATAVAALARLIEAEGQKVPIAVYRSSARNGGATPYTLIYGARRLAAMKALGHSHVAAVLRNKADALMLAITDNFARPALDALEQAEHLTLYREWWESRYGKIARGGDRKSKRHGDALIDDGNTPEFPNFYKEISDRFGINARTAQRLFSIGRIVPSLRNILRGTTYAKDHKVLKKLTKFGPAEQAGIASAFRSLPNLEDVLRMADPVTGRQGVGRMETGDWREQRFREAWDALPRDRRAAALDAIGATPKPVEAWPPDLPHVRVTPAPGKKSSLWAMLRDPFTHLSRKLSYAQIMAAKKAYEEYEAALRDYRVRIEAGIREEEERRREEFNRQRDKSKARAARRRLKARAAGQKHDDDAQCWKRITRPA